MVRQAHEQKVVPPIISIPALAEYSTVSLEELQDIFKLDLFGKTVEQIVLQYSWSDKLESPQSSEWRFDLYASLYKVHLMNATLARPYQQPFWSLSDVDRNNLAIFNEMTEEGHFGQGQAPYMKFLLDSDAYEFGNREKQERMFSDFAEWFHEDCLRSYDRALDRESSTGGDYMPYVVDGHNPWTLQFIGGKEESPKHECLACHVLRKFQQLLIMFGWLAGCHLSQLEIALYDFPQHYEDDIESEIKPQPHWTGHTEMLTIVPVGSFKLYNLSIPKDFMAAAKAKYSPRLSNLPDDSLPDLQYICQWAHNNSGQMNYRTRPRGGEAKTTEPPLLIFEYMLGKFFKKRFNDISSFDRYCVEWIIFFGAGGRFFGSAKVDQPYGTERLLTADTVDDGVQMYFYGWD